jgi:DNA-binding NarL/FixJ family response regulator
LKRNADYASAVPMIKTTPINPKLSYMASEFDTHFKVFHELMSNKVLEILLVASPYDAYILEEDGSPASKIINEYRGLNLSRPPRLTRVENARKALEILQTEHYDLVITMPHLGDMDPFDLGLAVKHQQPELPVILLTHSMEGLYPLPGRKDISGIDQIFIWSGDSDLLLAIVKSVEDRRNVDNDTQRAQVRVIILVEDSPLYRSYFLPLIYKEVVNQTQAVLEESLNEEHRLLKMRARPKILIAETYEAALALYERFQPYLFGVISDTRFPRDGQLCADAGYQLLRKMRAEIPDLPLLLLSSESDNKYKADLIPATFLDKNSPQLFAELHAFFLNSLGFGDFVFRTAEGREVARAANLRQLEAILPMIPEEPLCYHASRNRFSNWIMARSEIGLASRLRELQLSDFPDSEAMRQFLIASIHGLRKWRQKGVVAQFDAKDFDPQISDLVKIGHGSLGGKARGLAFAANLLRQTPQLFDKYPGIDICIPQTLVITTVHFDQFVTANRLQSLSAEEPDDRAIKEAFQKAEMPAEVVRELAAYLAMIRYPLAVRSSSLLEDAYHQPLAGLYKTLIVANNHLDDTVRLDQLIQAVKQVFASTWFELPRRFIRGSAFRHRKELMGVMIQQVTGRACGDYFYPAISGVARSQNFYPFGHIRPEDGMAKIAMGFGRVMNTYEGGLRFCPKYPRLLPDFSKFEDILAKAQRSFYALHLGGGDDPDGKESIGLELRQVADAWREPSVKHLISTFVPDENRIRDTADVKGPKLVTFAALLKYNTIPLAELLCDLLAVTRRGLGSDVEFEFALDISDDVTRPHQFHILQLRPMSTADPLDVELTPEEITRALCYSSQALGHGKSETVADLVYVKPESFDPTRTREMAAQIGAINAALKLRQRPYLLIGPGRWGSFDPWLGLPVRWEEINGAGAIVELRNAAIKADPSQGSHFFQQIANQGLPYLTITEDGNDTIRWELIHCWPVEHETHFIRHVRLPAPLLIKCDGRTSRGLIVLNERCTAEPSD